MHIIYFFRINKKMLEPVKTFLTSTLIIHLQSLEPKLEPRFYILKNWTKIEPETLKIVQVPVFGIDTFGFTNLYSMSRMGIWFKTKVLYFCFDISMYKYYIIGV